MVKIMYDYREQMKADVRDYIEENISSKKLTEKKRAELFSKIVELAVDYELVRMTPQEFDTLNICEFKYYLKNSNHLPSTIQTLL